MAERSLRVAIVGDSRDLERAFKKSSKAGKDFGRDMGRASRGAVAASGAFGGLGRSLAFASSAFLGGAGIVFALKSTISAAAEAQKVLGQTRNAVERSGNSWGKYRDRIDSVLTSQSNLTAFDDEQLSQTFANLVRRTGDVNEALRLNALAADVARARNTSLEQAANLVLKASIGQAGALRRLGIDAKKTADAQQLLDLLQRKYAGSAEAYGRTAQGAFERFRVTVENTQEAIGKALLPSITDALNRINDFLADPENQRKVQAGAEQTAAAVGHTVERVGKFVSIMSRLNHNAELFDKSVGLALLSPLRIIPQVNDKFESLRASMRATADTADAMGLSFNAALKEALSLKTAQGTSAARSTIPGSVSGTANVRLPGPPGTGTPFLALQLARAEATRGRRDDEQVLRQIIGVLKERLGRTTNLKAMTELRESLNQYQSQLGSLLGEDAQVVKDAADRVREKRQAARDKAQEALSILTDSLDKQGARLQDWFETWRSFAVAPELQLALAKAEATGKGVRSAQRRIRDSARAALDSGRLAIQGQIDAWDTIKQMNDALKRTVQDASTPFHKQSASAFARGIAGLSAAERKAVAFRFAQVGSGGTVPASGSGAFGFVIEMDGHKVGQLVTSRQQTRARRNPAQKRGPNAGHGI